MRDSIVTKLLELNASLNEAEKANFKLLLGLAAGGLTPGFDRPLEAEPVVAFDAVCHTLAQLQPYRDRVSGAALAYRGRPAFMTDQLLRQLQEEAVRLRPSAIRFDEHFLGCGAPVANQLALSTELGDFVAAHAGSVSPTGVASFLFYDEEGQGISPHIDTDVFALNVLVMLDHKRPAEDHSALVVFPPGRPAERVHLNPGETVILFAGSIAHGRERMHGDESVTILTFGFQPVVA